jgi:hypothetical protein
LNLPPAPMPEASHLVAGGRAKRYHRNPTSLWSAPRMGCHPFSVRRRMMASLRDADSLMIHCPVVSLVPRSTTGYRIGSLRDLLASSFSLSK